MWYRTYMTRAIEAENATKRRPVDTILGLTELVAEFSSCERERHVVAGSYDRIAFSKNKFTADGQPAQLKNK